MNWVTADEIDRTAKILVDTRGLTIDEADAELRSLVLQVDVGHELAEDGAAQAALLTVVNAGKRAFLGGVHVRLETDPILTVGWCSGFTASEAVRHLGGQLCGELDDRLPTLVIGDSKDSIGEPLLYLAWSGWAGGVAERRGRAGGPAGTELAGIAAAALGVSEVFQHQTGDALAGRRELGMSLWRPDLDWTDPDAVGPIVSFLPAGLWLLGLGHLGQAYAWTLGLLPYANPSDVQVGLVDFDVIVRGNTATQLLVSSADIGRRKTRVVADALERRGFKTRIVERAFDEHFHPVTDGDSARDEPRIALAGFDSVVPRRQLGRNRFDRVVDAGLGKGAEYLDMVIQTFPAAGDPATAFAARRPAGDRPLGSAYEAEVERQVAAGVDPGAARCGMVDLAGVTVGAAFVGTLASTIVIADLLRSLHDGGMDFSIVSLDLRAPDGRHAVVSQSHEPVRPRFTNAVP